MVSLPYESLIDALGLEAADDLRPQSRLAQRRSRFFRRFVCDAS
jgi:hypothetical protein